MADEMSGCRNVWWERASHFTVAASRFPRATTVEGGNDFGVASARFSASETDRCRGENTASAAVLPRAITDAEICELECTTEPAIDQMSVGFEGVGGGVVTHPAL